MVKPDTAKIKAVKVKRTPHYRFKVDKVVCDMKAKGANHIRVYLAGKISQNDWRHAIFRNLSGATDEKNITLDKFVYAGPYFICANINTNIPYNTYHGENTHGRGVGKSDADYSDEDGGLDSHWSIVGKPHDGYGRGPDDRAGVVSKCLFWIEESDIIFAWLDKNDAYGTLVELGLAHSLGKPIFLAMPIGFKAHQDMWFAWTLADMAIMTANHLQAWEIFSSVAEKLIKKSTAPSVSYQVDKNCLVTNIKHQ